MENKRSTIRTSTYFISETGTSELSDQPLHFWPSITPVTCRGVFSDTRRRGSSLRSLRRIPSSSGSQRFLYLLTRSGTDGKEVLFTFSSTFQKSLIPCFIFRSSHPLVRPLQPSPTIGHEGLLLDLRASKVRLCTLNMDYGSVSTYLPEPHYCSAENSVFQTPFQLWLFQLRSIPFEYLDSCLCPFFSASKIKFCNHD